jgi:hypothetical protein
VRDVTKVANIEMRSVQLVYDEISRRTLMVIRPKGGSQIYVVPLSKALVKRLSGDFQFVVATGRPPRKSE